MGGGKSLQNSRIDELSPRNVYYFILVSLLITKEVMGTPTPARYPSHAPSNFDKIYIIIVCWEEIFARYCIQRSNNDHFHPQFATIVFTIKSSSFSVVYN